jgi:predicted GIY-YIG superfamily endonuclease
VTTVYLLHFDRPFKHARHYMGSAIDLELRLAEHGRGPGARLLWWVHQAGISWRLARTWDGGRQRERQLKQRGHSLYCPICNPAPSTREVAAVTEQLPIGTRVRCDCPRFLTAAPIRKHIRHRPDGRIYFPPAAPHVGLQVLHQDDCPIALPALQVAS